MKHIFFISLISLFSAIKVCAQDLLVTVNRDTLNCKVWKMKNDHYPIMFLVEDEKERSAIFKTEKIRGQIHKDSVLFYKKDVFRNMGNNRLRPWYPLVEIGFDAGGAYQFGKFRMDDDLTDKSEFGARTGFNLGTDITSYASQHIGYGLTYNYRSLLDGDIHYQYVGPTIVLRLIEKNRSNHLFLSVSAGYGWMVQKNAPVDLVERRLRIQMYAHSISGKMAVGYSFRLSDYVSVYLKASCNIGYPGDVRVERIKTVALPDVITIDLGDYGHNMNTVNLTAGFSFHK